MHKTLWLSVSLVLAVAMTGGCWHSRKEGACPGCPPKTQAPAAAAEPKPEPVAAGMTRSAMAFPTGDRRSSVLWLERTAPAQVTVGQPFEYELRVTNLTSSTVSDVVVMDSCGENLKISGTEPPVAEAAAGQLRWELGDLAANASKTITVRGAATSMNPVTSCLSATYNQRACATISVVQPKLQLTVSTPPQALVCDNIPVRYTVTNNGTGVAKAVTIEQPLVQGLATSAGQNRVVAAVGDLGPGQSKTVEVMLKASGPAKVESVVRAAGEGGLKAEAPVSQVIRQPQLLVQLSGPQQVFVGRPITYKLTVTNKGDGEARNTVLELTAPAGVRLSNLSNAGIAAAGKATWNLGTLAPGQSVTVTVAADPQAMGALEVSASAQAYCAARTAAAGKTMVQGIPAILLEMVDVTDPVQVGQTTTYITTITNQGSMAATNVQLTWDLEKTMQFVSADGATAAKAQGSTVVCSPLPSLAPKAQAIWRVVVRAVEPGDVRMKVTLTSDQLTRPVEKTEATNFYE